VLRYTGFEPEVRLRPEMPVGPLHRVADNSLAFRLLGWRPQVSFFDGLHRTIDWYMATRQPDEVQAALATGLTEVLGDRAIPR
jgi:nucleoside-diphosphate-sugar epimerase